MDTRADSWGSRCAQQREREAGKHTGAKERVVPWPSLKGGSGNDNWSGYAMQDELVNDGTRMERRASCRGCGVRGLCTAAPRMAKLVVRWSVLTPAGRQHERWKLRCLGCESKWSRCRCRWRRRACCQCRPSVRAAASCCSAQCAWSGGCRWLGAVPRPHQLRLQTAKRGRGTHNGGEVDGRQSHGKGC